jgi:hypothetical protein
VLDAKIITQREFDAQKGKDSERALKYEGADFDGAEWGIPLQP